MIKSTLLSLVCLGKSELVLVGYLNKISITDKKKKKRKDLVLVGDVLGVEELANIYGFKVSTLTMSYWGLLLGS